MGVSLSGVGSGLDWQTMLQQLRKVEQNHFIKPLEEQKKRQEDILSAWNTVSSKLSNLLTSVQNLKDVKAFDVFTATMTSSSSVAPESLLSVTVGSGAAKGRFDIQVTNLAKAEKLQSVAVSSASQATGWTGTIIIKGHEVTLDGKSLNDLRDEINTLNRGSNATGVMASVLKVSDGDYRLILTSEKEGAAGIPFTDAEGDYFSTLQAGQDAVFSIDGVAMTRSSNTVTDAIAGVTLQLRGKDAGTTVTLNINRDEKAVTEKIQSFVDAYNGFVQYVNQQLTAKEAGKKGDNVLFGDVQLRSIKNRLQTALLDQELASYGVTFSREGTLKLDAEKFQETLAQDFSGTLSKFNDMAQNLQSVLNTLTDSVNGTVANQKRSVQGKIDKLEDRMETMEKRIDAGMERLKAQFIAMDNAMNTMNNQMSSLSQLFSSFLRTSS